VRPSRVRWGFGKAHHFRLIAGAKVVEALTPIGVASPATETQARELAPLLNKPNVLVEAWMEVVAEAATKGVKVTADRRRQRRCAT